MKYKLFSTKNCPKCLLVRNALLDEKTSFEVVDMGTPESQTELYSNGVFTMSAPVLQVDDKFYTVNDMFDGEKFRGIKGVIERAS
jgi:glutaredoxin